MTTRTGVVSIIDELVRERSLLKHPFYLRWTAGTLTAAELRDYAGQYYAFESALPQVLSVLLSRTSEPEHRQAILDNLWDEEHGEENHAELWLRFAEGLGMDRDGVTGAELHPATRELVKGYRQTANDEPVSAAVAALYAYESQLPEVATVKLAGLDRYDVPERARSFFKVHATLDIEHSAAERHIIEESPREEHDTAIAAAGRSLDAWWSFLDAVEAEEAGSSRT
jgi:pyrroloquinoline-quinone synthase